MYRAPFTNSLIRLLKNMCIFFYIFLYYNKIQRPELPKNYRVTKAHLLQ